MFVYAELFAINFNFNLIIIVIIYSPKYFNVLKTRASSSSSRLASRLLKYLSNMKTEKTICEQGIVLLMSQRRHIYASNNSAENNSYLEFRRLS